MIILKLKNADQETKIDFPCLHEHIRYRLEEIGLDGANAPKVLVREVEAPRALSFLESTYVNVDEINYLANEIESLGEKYAAKLYAIAEYKGYKEPKDLINAKFNLDCYTLIQDVRKPGEDRPYPSVDVKRRINARGIGDDRFCENRPGIDRIRQRHLYAVWYSVPE